MNRRWCEGLDWVRVEDLIEAAPDVYPKLLSQQLEWMADVHGGDAERDFRDEIIRRLKGGRFSEIQAECVVEAIKLRAEDARKDYEQVKKLVQRSKFRVVK